MSEKNNTVIDKKNDIKPLDDLSLDQINGGINQGGFIDNIIKIITGKNEESKLQNEVKS